MQQKAALFALDAPARTKASNYPSPYKELMDGRVKRPLGDLFNLKNFGVNITVLPPNCVSALHHSHSKQDEFIYVVSGTPTLITDDGEITLEPGMVAGFPSGGSAHHLENRSAEDCLILEVGDRSPGDEVSYPRDDIQAKFDAGKGWSFQHKDGSPINHRKAGQRACLLSTEAV